MVQAGELDVIVVTFNSERLLPAFIESVRRASWPPGLRVRITVVDNSSRDATRALADELADEVIDSGGNLGFGGAINLGVAATAAPQLLLANVASHEISKRLREWSSRLDVRQDLVGVVAAVKSASATSGSTKPADDATTPAAP